MSPVSVAVLVAAAVSGPVLTLAMAPPPRTGPVLVLAPPWVGGPEAVVLRAGGTLVTPRSAPLAALATGAPDDTAFAGRLRQAGAWMVADGTRLAFLCGVAS
jgi:hypothetical protein